jgi:hypothetical protein
MADTPIQSWRISKDIPITLVVAILLQTAAIIIWGVRLDDRVDNNQKSIAAIELYKEKQDTADDALKERVIKLEDRQSTEIEMLQRMDAVIEQQPTRKIK